MTACMVEERVWCRGEIARMCVDVEGEGLWMQLAEVYA